MAGLEDGRTFLVGTVARTRFDELYAIDASEDGAAPQVIWSLEIGARVNAIAVAGSRAYLATSADDAELIVVDLERRARVASFDAERKADAQRVRVEGSEIVLARRRNVGPEVYRLAIDGDVITVLGTAEDPRAAVAPKPTPLRRFRPRGRLLESIRHGAPGGARHFLLVNDRRMQFQVVRERAAVAFEDLNGDGRYVLGCVGDSNTSPQPGLRKWCEIIRDRLPDPDFVTVNVSVAGATVNPNLHFDSDATQQMAQVLNGSPAPDAVLLAFGTNDALQLRTPVQIRDAYLAQATTAEAAGIAFYVATTPPLVQCGACPNIEAHNVLLRDAFGDAIVEFFAGFTPEHFFQDGYHVNAAGQELRATRVVDVIRNRD